MEARLEFKGTGGELFGKLIGGAILTAITGGIYGPWFQVSVNKYVYSTTTLRGTKRGDLKLEFTGSGGELFKIGFLGMLLTVLTLGIYSPWMIANLTRFYTDHSTATAVDGTRFRLKTNLTGGDIFKTFLVGAILSAITLGIYLPWMICRIQQLVAQRTDLIENDRPIGRIDFVGRGADLFVIMLVGQILTMLTLGIYFAWLQVKMLRFFAQGTEVRVGNTLIRGDFTGTGGELFKITLVGAILTGLTLGIYAFWFLAKTLAFQLGNTVYRASSAAAVTTGVVRGGIEIPARPQPSL